MLNATEAFFFEGDDQFAVLEENSRNITVISVDTEDV
jgi:hypothetical protein